jgi:hypothetical protein
MGAAAEKPVGSPVVVEFLVLARGSLAGAGALYRPPYGVVFVGRWCWRVLTFFLTRAVAEPSGPGASGPQTPRKERTIDSVVVTLALLIVLLVVVDRITR